MITSEKFYIEERLIFEMVRTVRVASNVINTLLPLQPGLSLQQNTFLGDNPA